MSLIPSPWDRPSSYETEQKVDELLEKPEINDPSDDYSYASWGVSLVAKQYTLNRENVSALIQAVESGFSKSTQREIVQDLHYRAGDYAPSVGCLKLDAEGAKELEAFAGRLGLELIFAFNQEPPAHPLG